MITGYIGGIGTGKTMNAAREAIETATRRRAMLVSNITMTPADAGLDVRKLSIGHDGIDLDQLRALIRECQLSERGMVLMLDEVGILMPARFWQDFPIDLMYVLSQSRKLGVDLIYTAQDVEQVDATLRRLTTYVWLVKSFPPASIERSEKGKRPWLFVMAKSKVRYIDSQLRAPIGRRFRLYSRKWERTYSTAELVAPPEVFRARSRRRRERLAAVGPAPHGAGAAAVVPDAESAA